MTFSDPYSYITDLSERNICEALGLRLDTIKEYRKKDLTDGVDYSYGKFNIVTYSPTGFEKLLTFCGLRSSIEDGPVQAIITAFPANRNLMIAKLEDGREVKVRVKAINNFRKGMEITIQRDSYGIFELKSPYPNQGKFITVIQGGK